MRRRGGCVEPTRREFENEVVMLWFFSREHLL